MKLSTALRNARANAIITEAGTIADFSKKLRGQ